MGRSGTTGGCGWVGVGDYRRVWVGRKWETTGGCGWVGVGDYRRVWVGRSGRLQEGVGG